MGVEFHNISSKSNFIESFFSNKTEEFSYSSVNEGYEKNVERLYLSVTAKSFNKAITWFNIIRGGNMMDISTIITVSNTTDMMSWMLTTNWTMINQNNDLIFGKRDLLRKYWTRWQRMCVIKCITYTVLLLFIPPS